MGPPMFLRYPAIFATALGITLSLFFIMQLMVATGEDDIQPILSQGPIVITTELEDEAVNRREPRKPPRPEETSLPPTPDRVLPSIDPHPASRTGVTAWNRMPRKEPITPDSFNIDRDQAIPLVAVPPRYPARMAQQGIEGYVDVRFDITRTGAVVNEQVIYSTNRGFERSALKAIAKWKFDPRVVDGKPKPQFGVEKRIRYEFESG